MSAQIMACGAQVLCSILDDTSKKVHMSEPLPGNIACVASHREAGLYEPFADKLVINNKAVSASTGTITLNTDADSSPYASAAVTETLLGWKSAGLNKQLEVDFITLDYYAENNNIDIIHFLKVDVEGNEPPVFMGAKRLLAEKRILSVVFEFGTHQMGLNHYFRDFFSFFNDFGYDLYRARPFGWTPSKIPRYDTANENFSQVRSVFAAPAQN